LYSKVNCKAQKSKGNPKGHDIAYDNQNVLVFVENFWLDRTCRTSHH